MALAFPCVAFAKAGALDYPAWKQRYLSSWSIVQDAQRRWAIKEHTSVKRAMQGREIQVMHFPSQTCVQFEFTGPAVGGVPIYCYAPHRNSKAEPHFLAEFSDGE